MPPPWYPGGQGLVKERDFTGLPVPREKHGPQDGVLQRTGHHRYSLAGKQHILLHENRENGSTSEITEIDLGWVVDTDKVKIWLKPVQPHNDKHPSLKREVIGTGYVEKMAVKCIPLMANLVGDALIASGLANRGYEIDLESRRTLTLPFWMCQHGCEYEDFISDVIGGRISKIMEDRVLRYDLSSVFEGMKCGNVLVLPDYSRVWLFTSDCQKAIQEASSDFERFRSKAIAKFRVKEHCGESLELPGVIFWPGVGVGERGPSRPGGTGVEDMGMDQKTFSGMNFMDIMTRQKVSVSKIPTAMPTAIINIKTGQREFGVTPTRYIIISHCWSQETYLKWEASLREACASAGISHLWVDILCVPQITCDETEEWQKDKEIPRMGLYYSEASATLALVPDCENIVQGDCEMDEVCNWGLLQEKYQQSRKEVIESLWNSRGWTYQEARLSYNLCFTNSRAACNAGMLNYAWKTTIVMQEDFNWVRPGRGRGPNDHWQCSSSNERFRMGRKERFNLHRKTNENFELREKSKFWQAWGDMTNRDTTIREDRLYALMGIVDGLQCLAGCGLSLEEMVEHLIRSGVIGVSVLGWTGMSTRISKCWRPDDISQTQVTTLSLGKNTCIGLHTSLTGPIVEEPAAIVDDGSLEVKAIKAIAERGSCGPYGKYTKAHGEGGVVCHITRNGWIDEGQALLIVPEEYSSHDESVKTDYVLPGVEVQENRWHKQGCIYASVSVHCDGTPCGRGFMGTWRVGSGFQL